VAAPPTDSLDAVLAECLNRLSRAARDRRAAMHTPVVGSVDTAGRPSQRVMVLRAFDRDQAALRFHTDARAAKAGEIGAGAPVSVLCYDPGAKLQLRLSGRGAIETDTAAVDRAWDEATLFARRCYLADPAPGSISTDPVSGLPAAVEGVLPSAEQVAPARPNFAVLAVVLDTIEWLYLAHTGHRRARFRRAAPDAPWQGNWLVP